MVSILQKEHKVLRSTAKKVEETEITSTKIQNIIKDMQVAMHKEDDAVAIAAPQIGVSLRIFVVSGRALKKDTAGKEIPADIVYINPEIIKLSKDRKQMNEGCLSVRYLYGNVRRASRVTIRAYNEKGEKIERGASGLLAQIFQHEIDHLNGILFIDTATDIKDIPPEK